MLKAKIEADLKTAMLSGDAEVVGTLKMLKSAILYKEVELGNREQGLSDEQVIDVLSKEAKKRLEASEMYKKAARDDQSAAEKSEYDLIMAYLPKQLSDEEITKIVEAAVSSVGEATIKDMGRIIGLAKAEAGPTADGSRIASIVKQKLG